MTGVISTQEKAEYLVRQGLITVHRGELMLSSRAVALLTGTSEDAWKFLAHRTEPGPDEYGSVSVPDTFGRDVRRGAAETRARIGSSNPFDVLYQLARESEPRPLRRPASVDEHLRGLDQ